MSKLNVDLMLAVREQITSHPETHDQGTWALERPGCGTTLCIAGHAAVLAGEKLLWDGNAADDIERLNEGGRPISIWSAAKAHLGLGEGEAHELFSGALRNDEALALLDALIEKGKSQP